ncbi:MAG: SBBP repeat-containing protein [candidate division Zixibacteria bacterium]|nr:SBBP repeat-containing protein [candidate division Zixibacteria bacterium]
MQEHGTTKFVNSLTTALLIVFMTVLLVPMSGMAEGPVARGTDTQAGEVMISTFFGGSGQDGHNETPIVIDGDGNVFVATRTSSIGLPTSPGAFDNAIDGTYDVIIAKFSPDLSTLLACTYLGGGGPEGEWPGVDLVLDHQDNLIVALSTSSWDYPMTTGAYCDTLTGSFDMAISRISNDLTTLIASTYLGGSGKEWYQKVVILEDGRIVIAGCTTSSDFPVTAGAFDVTYGGGGNTRGDVFVSVLDSGLTTLLASTFLGESASDMPECLVTAPAGGVFVGGWTESTRFPTTPGVLFPSYTGSGSFDGFISHLSDDMTELVASTFIGGSSWDFVYDMALDGSGNILVTGHTASGIGFPVTESAYDTEYCGGAPDVGDDSYVVKLTPDLTTVLAGSYLGGSGWEIGECILADDEGRIYVAGSTNSTDFPYSPGTFDSTAIPGYKYASDVFVCCFDSSLQTMLFGTILGGNGVDNAGSIASDVSGYIYIGGATGAADFPASANAYDQTFNGGAWQWGGDIFISAFLMAYWSDSDGDGSKNADDNCPLVPNPGQEDSDGVPPGDACCCLGLSGNANNDPDDKVNISDVSYLLAYLFGIPSGPRPGCPAEANANGDPDEKVNISDVSYLLAYLFGIPTGPEPKPCP